MSIRKPYYTNEIKMEQYALAETLLEAKNISLKLGENQILKDVNVEIKNIIRPGYKMGQVVGFLGPSGIGKTKLFEILAGLLEPTSGTVSINTPSIPVKAGLVGVVQQNYPLFNHRTVGGNLEVAAKKTTKDANERKKKIDNILKRFNLSDKVNLYPAQLSGGQKQRVAIAQQLLCSENFLLLDEPFSGLDPLMVEEVGNMLSEIAHANELITIIVVSHDIISTASIADTLWIMGRDRDAKGTIIPGSKIKHTYNLVDKGLAWQKNIELKPEFLDFVKEIKGLFPSL